MCSGMLGLGRTSPLATFSFLFSTVSVNWTAIEKLTPCWVPRKLSVLKINKKLKIALFLDIVWLSLALGLVWIFSHPSDLVWKMSVRSHVCWACMSWIGNQHTHMPPYYYNEACLCIVTQVNEWSERSHWDCAIGMAIIQVITVPSLLTSLEVAVSSRFCSWQCPFATSIVQRCQCGPHLGIYTKLSTHSIVCRYKSMENWRPKMRKYVCFVWLPPQKSSSLVLLSDFRWRMHCNIAR